MSENVNLEINGLSVLQLKELKSALAEFGEKRITEKSLPSLEGESHGEPALIAVLIEVSPIILSAIALWLAKQKSRRTVGFRYEKTDGKGGSEVIEFERSSYEEGEAGASSIEAFFKDTLNAESE